MAIGAPASRAASTTRSLLSEKASCSEAEARAEAPILIEVVGRQTNCEGGGRAVGFRAHRQLLRAPPSAPMPPRDRRYPAFRWMTITTPDCSSRVAPSLSG